MQVVEQTVQLPPAGVTLKDLVADYERRLIEKALAATHGNQRRAAASLGLLPTTLHEKMKRLGLLRRADSGGGPIDEPLAQAS
jgi:sigma-54 specific flagellar transcriptional regulator A